MLEFLAYVERKLNYSSAVKFWKRFREDNMFVLKTGDPNVVDMAWERYSKQIHEVKPFSFVDCTIIETCLKESITDVLGFDEKLVNFIANN